MRRVRAHQHEPFGEVRLFARILTDEETAANVVEAEG
jgi:hypothetical protein